MRWLVFVFATTALACATPPKQAPTARVPIDDHPPREGVDVPCRKPASQAPAGEWVDPMSMDSEQSTPKPKPPSDGRVDCTGTSI